MMGAFSFLALLLATMGVYAMVSFSVAGRAGEMGVRAAMGAGRRQLVGMVVGESLVPVVLGVATFASWLPAWRASRIDPVEALRAR